MKEQEEKRFTAETEMVNRKNAGSLRSIVAFTTQKLKFYTLEYI